MQASTMRFNTWKAENESAEGHPDRMQATAYAVGERIFGTSAEGAKEIATASVPMIEQ